jgi:hypothetical protein
MQHLTAVMIWCENVVRSIKNVFLGQIMSVNVLKKIFYRNHYEIWYKSYSHKPLLLQILINNDTNNEYI